MPLSFKMVGLGLLLLLIGIFLAQKELRLRVWGQKAQATITGVNEVRSRRNTRLEASYVFPDAQGKKCKGAIFVPDGWTPSGDGTLEILYVPGSPEVNRPAANSESLGFWILALGLGLTVFGGWYFLKKETVVEAHAETMRTIEEARKPPSLRRSAWRSLFRLFGGD
jgi:hypothetical protein